MDRSEYLAELQRRRQRQSSTARTIAIAFGIAGGVVLAIVFALAASRGRSQESSPKREGPTAHCLGSFRGDGEMMTEPFAIFSGKWFVDWESWAGELGGAEASGVFSVYLMVPGEAEGRPIVSSAGPGKNRCTLTGPGKFQIRVVSNQPWSLAVYDYR